MVNYLITFLEYIIVLLKKRFLSALFILLPNATTGIKILLMYAIILF